MKGDFSRKTFNPTKHYRSVLKQQGRVDVDADWNEQQAINMRRIETEATDVIGGCGAPLHDAGFHIVTGVAQLTIEERKLTGNLNPPKLKLGDFLISAGRYYVDGILCENEEILTYTTQPDMPGAQVPIGPAGFYLVYLDVWQRHITALDDPLIREKALGGPDTATRAKVVWQVRTLQVTPPADLANTTIPKALGDPKLAKTLAAVRVATGKLPAGVPPALSQAEKDVTTLLGKKNKLDSNEALVLGDNILASLKEITLPPKLRATLRKSFTGMISKFGAVVDAARQAQVGCDSLFKEWPIAATTGTLNARTQPPDPTEQACLLPPSAGYLRLENQLYRVEILKLNADMTPFFVWSRDNGTVVTTIKSISGKNVVVADVGPDDVLGFAKTQWVEIIDDKLELNGTPGQLLQIESVDARTITMTTSPLSTFGDLKNPKLRRWDQTGNTATPDGVAITFDQWQPLEDGIEVMFSRNDAANRTPLTYKPGDYWLIPARTATGEIEWPPYEVPNKYPAAQPPLGIKHHYCKLALVGVDVGVLNVIEDCRKIFPPLTELQSDSEPGVQITGLLVGNSPLVNDTGVRVKEFVQGLRVVCSANIAKNSVKSPTCFVTLEMPFSFIPKSAGPGSPPLVIGFQPLILDGSVAANANIISWTPTTSTQLWLNETAPLGPFQLLNSILVRLTLQGNFIWSDQNPDLFLDGEVFGISHVDPYTFVTRTHLRLPSGNRPCGGDFNMWFWLMP